MIIELDSSLVGGDDKRCWEFRWERMQVQWKNGVAL